MIKSLREIISTRTFRHTVITSSGTFVNGALGAIFYILMARFLGPSSFGVFSIAVAAQALLADVFDLGTSTGLVKFVGRDIVNNQDKAFKFLKLSLQIKTVTWFWIIIIGWFTVPFVAIDILGKEELILPLRYSLIGVGGALFFTFAAYSLQALQKFWEWSLLNVATNFLRLLLTIILFVLGYLTIYTSLGVYIFVPFVGFLAGLLFLPHFWRVSGEQVVGRELFGYNSWVAIFTLIAAISSRLDTFLIARFLSLSDVGIYSLASQLVSIVSQVTFALGTVVAPKLAGMDTKKKAINYLTKLQAFVTVLAVGGTIIGIIISIYFIPIFYGAQYSQAVLPFAVLLISQAVFLFSVPVHMSVFYYFSYPRLFVYISAIHLVIILVLGQYMITNFGYMGAAYTVLIGAVSNFILPAIWVVKKFNQK